MQTLVEQPKNNEATIDAIKLYIPDECKADLLSFIKQLCLYRKKREVTKQYFKRTLNDYGLASMPEISIADAWARCIVDVESESPKTA